MRKAAWQLSLLAGQNVGAGGWQRTLSPNEIVCMLREDAEVLNRNGYAGTIDDRERPDTAEAEAERQANRKNYERWLTVFSHPATRHAGRERVHKAVNLLAETNKTPQEILWFLMGEKPFLLGKSA